MPIFEYICEDCQTKFETLKAAQYKDENIECPKCKSVNCRKLLSVFSTSAKNTSSYNFEAPSCKTGNCNFNPAPYCDSCTGN